METNVVLTLLCFAALLLWWWIDLLISRLEMVRGIPGWWIGGIALVVSMSALPSAMPVVLAIVAALTVFKTAYYLRIR